jgi:hypothetical protein
MEFVLAEMNKDLQHYYMIPEHECCGDVAVAVILRDYLDFNLTGSWPMIQGETPETLDYTNEKWCKTGKSDNPWGIIITLAKCH